MPVMFLVKHWTPSKDVHARIARQRLSGVMNDARNILSKCDRATSEPGRAGHKNADSFVERENRSNFNMQFSKLVGTPSACRTSGIFGETELARLR